LQITEYVDALFTINSGVYGSTFYLAMEPHGFHVMLGALFLLVCLFHQKNSSFIKGPILALKRPPGIGNPVEVVWLFLFITIS